MAPSLLWSLTGRMIQTPTIRSPLSGAASPLNVHEPIRSSDRRPFIDNLRSSLLFLVVAFHTTITYSHIGSWYYKEPARVDGVSAVAFFTFEAHCQAFFMGLLFLLAGYFVPDAFDRKGCRRFLRDRFIRLGVPSLVYIFIIQPVLQHFLLHFGDSFLGYYRGYLLSGDVFTGSGPMWFALALLIFSLVYALLRTIQPSNGHAPRRAVPGPRVLLIAGLAMGAVSFLVRLVQPMGSNVLNMQLCFFTQYIMLFVVGIAAARNGWLEHLPTHLGYTILAGAVVLSPAAFIAVIIPGGFLQNGLSPFLGGWQWQSAAYAFWEQMACVALCTGMLVLFREKFCGGGRLSKLLAKDSFGIYFLHPPVVVAVTQAFGWLRLPPLVKAIVMVPIAYLSVLTFVYFGARRIPGLKRLL